MISRSEIRRIAMQNPDRVADEVLVLRERIEVRDAEIERLRVETNRLAYDHDLHASERDKEAREAGRLRDQLRITREALGAMKSWLRKWEEDASLLSSQGHCWPDGDGSGARANYLKYVLPGELVKASAVLVEMEDK